MTQLSTALGRSQGLAQGLATPARQRRGVRPARRCLVPSAAAVSTETDLGALLRESLQTPPPKKLVAPAEPAPAPVPAPAAAVDAAPPAGPVPEVVPGTEILPSALPPPSGASASTALEKVSLPDVAPAAQVQGFDIDAWREQIGGASKVAKVASSAVPKASSAAADSAAAAASQLTGAVDSLGSSTSAAVSQASEAAAQAADAVTGAVSGAASALTEGVGGAASAIGGSVSSAAGVLSESVGGAASALTGVAGEAAGAAGEAVSAVSGAVSGFTGRFSAVLDEEVGIVKSNLAAATGAVQSGVAAAEQAVGGAVSGALDQLPAPVKDALVAAGGLAAEAVQTAAATPETAAAAAGVAVGLPVLLIWQAAFGGYSGQLKPQQALELLQTQDALLVDVRTEAQRLQNGTVELKRGALGKGAAVPPVQLLPSIARRVRSAGGLELEILAAQIVGLSKVGGATKVIIMDEKGDRAKPVARAVAAAGKRAYVLQGGFKGWQAAGLKVRPKETEYDAGLVDAVEDQVEQLAEVTTSQLEKLKDPITAATALGAVSALGFAALNFHTVLQFLGVLGLEWTLYQKYQEYDSLEDALEDLSKTLAKLTDAASGAGALLPAASTGSSAAAPAASKPAAPAAPRPAAAGQVANSDDE